MAHLDRKIKIIIFSIFIGVCLYLLLFQKQKNYYRIKNLKIKELYIKSGKLYQFDDSAAVNPKEFQFIGVSIEINKEYISKPGSRRILFGGSMEKGIDGISRNSLELTLLSNTNINIDKYLFAELNGIDKNDLGARELTLYEKHLSLSKFIANINSNEEYTRGISFDTRPIFFIFNKQDRLKFQNKPKIILKIINH
ncbi:hypothetical protein [Flavobacterium cheonhonense]|uniref:hypothetical protein n=1 Tax=Flavobacterium cheonhonense TaxID=706185 RepID=UPI002D7968FA|nr:hypothetical protein [Flavobacterium cheonhonense]